MTTTSINLPYVTVDETGPKHLDVSLSRAKFDELTDDLVDKTIQPLEQAMKDSGLKPSDIGKILLVGGSTRIPAVQERVTAYFGQEPFKGINPDECVAIGAAIQAGVLSGDVEGLVLLDVTPLSLGIETLGGVMTKIIDRNTTIPTKKSQIFSTAQDGQTQVEVHVLQGEREFANDNKTLGNFILDGIAPAPRGIPQIEVTFDIDANGIVNVSAVDKGTNRKQNITITASTNLSDEEIDQAVKEAEKFAEEDKKRKEEVEIKNQADSTVYQTEKTLKDLGDKLDAAEKESIEAEIKKLKDSIEKNDLEGMKTNTEAVQQALYKVSEKLYQQQAAQEAPQDGAAGQEQSDANAGQTGGTYEADFKDVGSDEE